MRRSAGQEVSRPKKVVLVVERGASTETEFELPPNGYRAIGRASDGDVTHQFTTEGDQALDTEDIKRVEEHLAKRQVEPASEPGRLRMGNLRRAPDILLDDAQISRTHAMFFLDEDGPSVVDMFSTNGTRVNGEKVDDADLHEGDIVHIGRSRFVVRLQ